jgi:hypothetical protein
VRATISNDFNAGLKRKVEDILQVAESNSETYMNEFQKQRDQIEDYRNQMSLKFRSL